MLSEKEAKHIADSIKDVALHMIHVESIEQNPKTDGYQIRCKYHGPTMKYGQQLFLHGMSLSIKKSYEWTRLYRLLNRN
jgi:hypothetical protein